MCERYCVQFDIGRSIAVRILLLLCSVLVSNSQLRNCAFAAETLQTRPNILFIYADDQSYKTISAYGANPSWVETPNIDALARSGIRFERAYLGAWCMPSRASILTGKLQHGIQTMRMAGDYPGSTYDPAACPFLPAEFRKQGYQTAQIGKWHTGTDTGFGRDWDYQVVWNRPRLPDNAGNYYTDQILTINGVDRLEPSYSTDNYTKLAVEYIRGENRNAEKPWYLWLCYGAIHGPTTPADRHFGTFAGKSIDTPQDIFGPWPDKPAYLERVSAWVKGPDGKPAMRGKKREASNFDKIEAGLSLDAWVQQVNECNRAVDEGVGQLMDALRESGQLKNTLVVYTADQGYALGEHGLNQKVAPYDASLASALIVSHAGKLSEARVCPQPVNSPDLVQWLCNVAEVEIPWKTHGRDIWPLMKQPETAVLAQPMLLTHTSRSYGSDTDVVPTGDELFLTAGVPWYVMLRDGPFKYVRYLLAGETEELYDLKADPEEMNNLARHPEHQSRMQSLRSSAIDELRRTDAGFVDQLPAVKAFSH